MLSTPRTIFFQTELQFLPIDELKFGKSIGRKLYTKMSENSPYAYDSINIMDNKIELSTPRGSGQSICQIDPHSIRIEEQKAGFHVDEFVSVINAVLDEFKTLDESCPPVIVQRCKIQCLSQPHGSNDSLVLLAGNVANVLDKIEPFGRPPSFFGVRFRFLPEDLFAGNARQKNGGELVPQTVECKNYVTMRFETYAQDLSQVWMEVAATYPILPPIEVTESEEIGSNIKQTHRFLVEKGKDFLEQFDKKANNAKE